MKANNVPDNAEEILASLMAAAALLGHEIVPHRLYDSNHVCKGCGNYVYIVTNRGCSICSCLAKACGSPWGVAPGDDRKRIAHALNEQYGTEWFYA